MKTILKNTVVTSALVLASTAAALAQATTPPAVSFDPIMEAANWQTLVIPAMMGIAGAIAGVLVIRSGIGWVLGSIRSAGR